MTVGITSRYAPGVVYQEDGSWRAHAQRRCKDASSLWVLEATAVMQQSADKVRLLMVQTFIYSAVMYGAEVWIRRGVKDKMSAVVKALRSILACIPRLLF
jgi:hypothetical protein